MNKKKLVIINSSFGLISQIVAILFQFVIRKYFLQFFGINILGLNSTYTSIIGALSLAELGFQTSIIFRLYNPLEHGNYSLVNSIVSLFCYIYRAIGCFFIAFAFIILPFIHFIVDYDYVNVNVYLCFILQSLGTAVSYFLAYKRTLLNADQKGYIAQEIDLIINVICSILLILSCKYFQNYYLFLVIKIIQVIISNALVDLWCKKNYPFLTLCKFDRGLFKEIWRDVRNVFAAKLAGYIYNSTDSILISILINTATVGYYANYYTISSGIRTLSNSFLNPITPIVGRIIAGDDDNNTKKRQFLIYSYIRGIVALMIVVPMYTLLDDFINIWVGNEYIIGGIFKELVCADLFIHLAHGACLDYINGTGLFKEERNIEIVGAIINISLSIVLGEIYGIDGIVMATVIAQLFFWFGRGIVVTTKCFKTKISFKKYTLTNCGLSILFIMSLLLSKLAYTKLTGMHALVKLIFGAITSEMISITIYVLFTCKTNEFRQICDFVKN